MVTAALGLLVVLSVESFKASSRYIHKRRSLKHGYSSLRTDKLGRPLSEDGKRLSKNEARALAAHNKEIERIRTAEREWRAKGERLPAYGEESDEAIIQSLSARPRSAPASESVERMRAVRPRATSTASAPALAQASEDDLGRSISPSRTVQTMDGGAFSVRRRTQTLVLPTIPSGTEEGGEEGIEDIFQHDGLDWRRATWEGPPIYSQDQNHPQEVVAVAQV